MPGERRWLPKAPDLPGLRSLRRSKQTARADAIAGIAVAAYLVPQCMAYARLAGVEAASGLWAAIAALLLYALLGTSTRLSVGPESASALLVGSAVASLGAGLDRAERQEIAAALALAVATVALVAWALRLGFLADLLSRPVLVGYMAGVAVAMVVSQLPNITGIPSSKRDTLPQAADVLGHVRELRAQPFVMAVVVVTSLVVLQRFRRVPGPLVVVLAATAVTALSGLEDQGVATIGHLPAGLPAVGFPGIAPHLWPAVFAAALGISAVVFSDNMVTARAFATRGGDRIDATQELLALAGANAAAGAVGAFPVSSSASRTALADVAGGQTQLTSVVAAAAVVAVLLFGRGVLESFPLAALGGLVIYAAVRLIDLVEVRRITRFRRSEAFLLTAACTSVVLFGVLPGIATAVALSVAELFARVARAHDAVQGEVPGLAGLHDVDVVHHAPFLRFCAVRAKR